MAQEQKHILSICTGNICRSPMAARLLAHALAAEEEPLKSLQSVSAGVAALDRYPASRHSITAMRKVGLDLNNHCSQQVSWELLASSVAVFCMTESHRAQLVYHFDPLPAPVYLLREFLPSSVSSEIPDPYGMNLPDYETCRDSIVEALPSVIRFLREHYSASNTQT